MPVSKYFHGHGREVMKDMKQRYGKRAKNVFYATANAKHQNPGDPKKKKKTLLG